uniref:Uncharacterized protein n=1 Tax=Klebsiella pneumoniae TaxID=573 RepID=A0A8B0SRA1_KLEPN|nr:hypothetical protein [Klebsiella pneumoniae]
MRTIEELGKRAALLKMEASVWPFRKKCPVCYGILTGCKLCGGNGRVIQEDIDARKNNIKNKF